MDVLDQSIQNSERKRDIKIHFTCSCDLDLEVDPITLIYDHDLDIHKTYLQTENELFRSRLSKVRALQTDRQRDKCDGKYYQVIFVSGGHSSFKFLTSIIHFQFAVSYIVISEQMYQWTNEWINERINEWRMIERNSWKNEWMNERTNERANEYMNELWVPTPPQPSHVSSETGLRFPLSSNSSCWGWFV